MGREQPRRSIPPPPAARHHTQPQQPPLVPALVVVDSRNILHQAEAATGYREHPCVDGVVDAMADYGFDALEVHVGLALPRARDARRLAAAGAENEAFKKRIEASDRGSVLLGELHSKEKGNGRYVAEEKQVDVACAVDICRHATLIARHESDFRAIVVLSQDTDLTPALRYADEVHVPVVVAAYEGVEHRGFPYALLTERAFRKVARVRQPVVGHALRCMVVRELTADGENWAEWEVVGWDNTRERFIVARADGLRGVVKRQLLEEQSATAPGSRVRLRPAGVNFGTRRNNFPLLACTPKNPHPQHDHRDQLTVRTVAARRAVNEVGLDEQVYGKRKLPYPPGGVSTGTQVLIDCSEPHRPLVVGPLELPADRELHQAAPVLVEPFQPISPTTTAASSHVGGRIVLSHSAAARPELGRRYAAVLVDGRVAKLISSPLP